MKARTAALQRPLLLSWFICTPRSCLCQTWNNWGFTVLGKIKEREGGKERQGGGERRKGRSEDRVLVKKFQRSYSKTKAHLVPSMLAKVYNTPVPVPLTIVAFYF